VRLINSIFSVFKLRQQACNGTRQDQQKRWNKAALLPSANVPKSGVPYSALNQNQHKKGKLQTSGYLLPDVLPIIQGSSFYVVLIEGARTDG